MHESNGQPPGPSNETLKHLAGMLPSYAKAVAEKKLGGKGRKEEARVPRKVCQVCGVGMDYGPQKTALPEVSLCEYCKKELKDGYTAFVSGDRYVIAKSARLADMAGKVVKISPHVLEKLSKEFELEWKVKNEHDNTGKLEAGDSGPV